MIEYNVKEFEGINYEIPIQLEKLFIHLTTNIDNYRNDFYILFEPFKVTTSNIILDT